MLASQSSPSNAFTPPVGTAGRGPVGRSNWVALALAALMLSAAFLAVAMRPAARAANSPPSIVLDSVIPKQFGDWRELPSANVQVVNPQTQELLDKLYSQTLSRTYINSAGYRVMLSLAYGDDQRGGLQAHMPEVCYPAQGFRVHSVVEHRVETQWGGIQGKRVVASLGARAEPITYWFAMGDRAVSTNWEKRLVEIRLGLTGQVPDGLLFRISSIDGNSENAFAQHQLFARDLLNGVAPGDRGRLAGLDGRSPQ